jgi:nitrite reductase (NADH) small subunit/3-phenylpropionate/trans-cinnamate dioxygenase ferredoxin subunit
VSRFVVGKAKELPPGLSRSVRAGGRRVALFNEGGSLFAVDEACPHMGADLSNGDLRDGTLTCAWHHWRFDIRTGQGLTRSWARLKTHRLFREGEDLVLEVEETPPQPLQEDFHTSDGEER